MEFCGLRPSPVFQLAAGARPDAGTFEQREASSYVVATMTEGNPTAATMPHLFQEETMNEDLQILMLIKPGNPVERFIVTFDDAHRADAFRLLGRWAANEELSFSWMDAAVLSQRLRETALEAA